MAATLDNRVAQVLEGNLDNLPKQESTKVRIFLSSTFTDHTEERNYLTREIFPVLRSHFQNKGYEFQIADMRWGVRDDAQNDHQTTAICLKQVEDSYRTSRGPYLAIFLGNKYGYRPFPNAIEENEYEAMYDAVDTFNTTLLREWFLLDQNMVPPCYILQPITSRFPHYNDESEENADSRETDKENWGAVDTLLTNIFREAATQAYKKGNIDKETMRKYQRSVTEAEINAGLLSKDDSRDRVFCFLREFTDFSLYDARAKRYTDLDGNDYDEEAMELLKNLKSEIPNKLSKEYIHYCTVPWIPDGITEENDTHKEYLQRLGKLFKETVMKQVLLTFKGKENYGMWKPLYQEVLHHSTFGVQKVRTFSGRKELIREIKKKVTTQKSDAEAGEEKIKMMEAKLKKMEQLQEQKVGMKQMMLMQAGAKQRKNVDSDEEDEGDAYDDHDDKHDDDADVQVPSSPDKTHTKENELDELSRHLDTLGIKFSREEQETNPSEKLLEELEMMPLEKYTSPLVLYGESGCGKTALMAKLASEVDGWFTKPIMKIIRFLGTSPKSNTLKTLLLYLCKQIWYNYNIEDQDAYDLDKDIAVLILYFHALLRRIDSDSMPLVIILDSLDQLDGSDNAFSMMWLPKTTPANVCIIVSMIPHMPGLKMVPDSNSESKASVPVLCLDNARKNLGDEGHFVEVPQLPDATAEEILNQWMKNCNQTLTDDQLKLIFDHFKREPQPLYLKLIHDQSKLWKSYTPVTACLLGETIQAAIEKLFSDLEIQHGDILVSKALGYLTAAKHGLTDTELEDILSLDDEVLQDTYLYHLPPDPTVVRLPPLLWQRIRSDLGEFLVEREADGSSVFNWYHRQFMQVAKTRYVFSSEQYAQGLHSMLADFFIGAWSGKAKPIEMYKRKRGSYPDAQRQVQSQPNCFENNRYNYRKLTELPFHLILSGRSNDLVTLTNELDWLYTKSKAKGIQEVLNDLQFAKTAFVTQGMSEESEVLKELDQLYKILILRSDALWKDPGSLPVQILGQLGANKEQDTSGLAKLLEQCQTWCYATASPVLVPTTRCLPYPEPSVKMALNICIANLGDPSENERKCAVSENGQILYAVDKQKQGLGDLLKVFDMAQENQLRRILPLKGMDVKTIYTIANKYLHLVLYLRRDNFDPKLNFKLYNENLVLPSGVKEDDQVRGVTSSGSLAFVLHPIEDKTKDKEEESELWDTSTTKPMDAFLVNLDKGERLKFNEETNEVIKQDVVKHALFSPDEKYLVMVLAKDGGLVIDVKTMKVKTHLFKTEKDPFAFTRGVADHHLAEQTTKILPDNKIIISKTSFSEYSSLVDMETGEVIYDLWRKNTDKYSADKMAVNKAQTLVAMGSSSSGTTNGNHQKDCVIWNVITGIIHAVVPNNKGWFSWIGFCGKDDEYVICCHDYSKQIVDIWYVGTIEDPLPYPEAIKVLDLCTVTQTVRYFSNVLDGSYFITASVDNTVTFHNMKYIDEKCKKILPEKLEKLQEKFADGQNKDYLDELMGLVEKYPERDWSTFNKEKDDGDKEDKPDVNGSKMEDNNKENATGDDEVQCEDDVPKHLDENADNEDDEANAQETDEIGDAKEIHTNEDGALENIKAEPESQVQETKPEEADNTQLDVDKERDSENGEQGQGDTDGESKYNENKGGSVSPERGTLADNNKDNIKANGGQETEEGYATSGQSQHEVNSEKESDAHDDLGENAEGQSDEKMANDDTTHNGVKKTEEKQTGDVTENTETLQQTEEDQDQKDEQENQEKDTRPISQSASSVDKEIKAIEDGSADGGNEESDEYGFAGFEGEEEEKEEEEQEEEEEELLETCEPLPEPGQARITSTSLTLTRDGKTAVVGTLDGWVVFIDLETGKVIRHYKQGDNRVHVSLATSTGKYVATAEKKTVVWNTGSWDKYFIITTQSSIYGGGPSPSDLAEANDILVVAVAGMECFGYVWNLETKQMIIKLPGLYGFSQVVITSDAKKVVTTFFDFPVVMNVEGEGQQENFNMNQVDTMMAGCSCLCLSPDDRLVLSGSTDGSVRVMEIASGKFIFRMQHLSSVKQAAFSPDSRHMITGGFRSILIWSTQDGSLVTSLANHQEFIDCFCFSNDGNFLISGSLDKRIIVWDFQNHSSVTSFTAHCPVSQMKATPDLSSIVYCPTNIDYLAIMNPNPALKNILQGEKLEVPDIVQRAQALALSFTPGSVKKATSRSCAIL